MPSTDLNELAAQFDKFALAECRDSSPLYYALSTGVARDSALLNIAAQSGPGQPVPNLFFGVIHSLLIATPEEQLANYYPDLRPQPLPATEAFAAFKEFILARQPEMIGLLQSRRVQTNEVRRCAYLFPSFLYISKLVQNRPLALIEIGTSAGLNLLWDQYSYRYNDGPLLGQPHSRVQIASQIRGEITPPLTHRLSSIGSRIGVDLNIIDTNNPTDRSWLKALVWPEHAERRQLLDAAIAERSRFELDLRKGDGFKMIGDLVDELPPEFVPCIYHTHVANQIPEFERNSFLERLSAIGRERDLVHLHNNIRPTLHLNASIEGKFFDLALARTEGHARWVEWLQN